MSFESSHAPDPEKPQITQIDADDITKSPGLNLRYLRHQWANMGSWKVIRNPKSEIFTARWRRKYVHASNCPRTRQCRREQSCCA